MPVRPPQGQSCATCWYWMATECHKNPPFVVLQQLQANAVPITKWAVCLPTDWCAAWNATGP